MQSRSLEVWIDRFVTLAQTLKRWMSGRDISVKSATHSFEQGCEFEKLGMVDEALLAYKEAILLDLSFAQAHFKLGNLLLDSNRAAEALMAYLVAAELKPDSAGVHYNLALTHLRLGSTDKAISACLSAIHIKTDFGDAHLTLGSILLEVHLLDEAIKSFDSALRLMPDCAQAHQNKGVACQELGRFKEAAECYLQALAIDSKLAECRGNLAGVYMEMGLLSDALYHYKIVEELAPVSADVYHNYALALTASGDVTQAIICYRKAIKIRPEHIESFINLGNLLARQAQFEEALRLQRNAVELQPQNFNAHLNLGITLLTTGNIAMAKDSLRRAVKLNPNSAEANLCLGSALKDSGNLIDALEYIEKSLELNPDYLLAHNVLLFTQNYVSNMSAQAVLEKAIRFNSVVNRLATPYTTWKNSRNPQKKLRIGFVSGDLCDHPVGYFVESVVSAIATFQEHRLEVFAYLTRDNDDAISVRIKANCSALRMVGNLSDESLAGVIYQDSIDILIDLAGHSAHNRLSVFAWRAAPVQATWLGYFATTGLSSIDYLIADPWTLPSDQEKNFTEKIWRLPETRLCFSPPDVDICVNTLPAKTNRYITFGSFNNLSKIGEPVLELWASLLLRTPNSVLLVKAKQLSDLVVRQQTLDRFARHGISKTRLILEGHQSRAEYFATYHKIDFVLDSFPYPGGTTTVESLWMGVPVLTLAGEKFLSRQGVGLLMNAGLSDWIAKDPEEYLSLATSHSQDFDKLELLRANLRGIVTKSALFDAKSFVSHLESCFRDMWSIWCKE